MEETTEPPGHNRLYHRRRNRLAPGRSARLDMGLHRLRHGDTDGALSVATYREDAYQSRAENRAKSQNGRVARCRSGCPSSAQGPSIGRTVACRFPVAGYRLRLHDRHRNAARWSQCHAVLHRCVKARRTPACAVPRFAARVRDLTAHAGCQPAGDHGNTWSFADRRDREHLRACWREDQTGDGGDDGCRAFNGNVVRYWAGGCQRGCRTPPQTRGRFSFPLIYQRIKGDLTTSRPR